MAAHALWLSYDKWWEIDECSSWVCRGAHPFLWDHLNTLKFHYSWPTDKYPVDVQPGDIIHYTIHRRVILRGEQVILDEPAPPEARP